MTARAGQRLPNVKLAEIVDSEMVSCDIDTLLAGKKAIIIGMPGAFTPVCTDKHIPQFVRAADSLKSAGYDLICCVIPNDPWVVDRMAKEVDPKGKLRFLSDGNLEFARAAGLESDERRHFMGERSRRYMIVLNNAVVERLNVEATNLDVSCTRVKDVIEL